MSRALIVNGVWSRRVPAKWQQNGKWRTAIFKSVLTDSRLKQCRYILEGGPTVVIPVKEMRHAIEDGPDYNDGRIWGPFNIDPIRKTVADTTVKMQFETS